MFFFILFSDNIGESSTEILKNSSAPDGLGI